MSDEFVPLICPQCTGKIKISKEVIEESFVHVTDDTVVFIGGSAQEKIACEHCKTEFVRKQKLSVAPPDNGFALAFNQSGQTAHGAQVNINTGGGAYIGGSITVGNGDFVGRNKTVIVGGNVRNSVIITGDDVVIGRRSS